MWQKDRDYFFYVKFKVEDDFFLIIIYLFNNYII